MAEPEYEISAVVCRGGGGVSSRVLLVTNVVIVDPVSRAEEQIRMGVGRAGLPVAT